MTGKTHQLIGLATGLAAYLLAAPPGYAPATLGTVLVVSHLAALLPDLDRPAADIWGKVPLGRVAGQVVDPFFKHRNISHSLVGIAGASGLFWLLLQQFPLYWGINTHAVLLAFSVAYTSHLVADMVTVEGIPLLWPLRYMLGFPPYPFNGLRIVTGKWFENLVVFPLINLVLVLEVWHFWPSLRLILFR